jgi:hypothetical protein
MGSGGGLFRVLDNKNNRKRPSFGFQFLFIFSSETDSEATLPQSQL